MRGRGQARRRVYPREGGCSNEEKYRFQFFRLSLSLYLSLFIVYLSSHPATRCCALAELKASFVTRTEKIAVPLPSSVLYDFTATVPLADVNSQKYVRSGWFGTSFGRFPGTLDHASRAQALQLDTAASRSARTRGTRRSCGRSSCCACGCQSLTSLHSRTISEACVDFRTTTASLSLHALHLLLLVQVPGHRRQHEIHAHRGSLG